jgi:ATP-dependent Clp protease ATP-binding subunit ClpA
VTFAPLTPEVMGRVVDQFVRQVQAKLKERKVELELTPAARDWLAEKGYDPDFGARPMARTVQTELEDRLSDELLFGRLARGGKVTADRGDDALVFRFAETPAPLPA